MTKNSSILCPFHTHKTTEKDIPNSFYFHLIVMQNSWRFTSLIFFLLLLRITIYLPRPFFFTYVPSKFCSSWHNYRTTFYKLINKVLLLILCLSYALTSFDNKQLTENNIVLVLLLFETVLNVHFPFIFYLINLDLVYHFQ